VTVPRPLTDVLTSAAGTGGADSAERAYRALRERYYGRSAYDFGEGTLSVVAGRLARERRFDDATAMARLNVEFFPRSGAVQAGLGDVLRLRGDTTGAVAAYRQALQLDPGEQGARNGLRALGQTP
jgi:tetratricopeptide (TPR) repeat protein